MANKYIDVSATYNGDGTAPNQAASAGAPGAWNSLAYVLANAPAYGALNAGDTVYIRTESGGSNLSETLSASTTMAARGSFAAPVNWIFDNMGTVWPGDSGVFTLTIASTYTFTGRDYNNFIATAPDGFVFASAHSANTALSVWTLTTMRVVNAVFDVLNASPNFVAALMCGNNTYPSTTVFEKCKFFLRRLSSTAPAFSDSGRSVAVFSDCEFDITGGNAIGVLFSGYTDGKAIILRGGRLIALQTQFLYSNSSGVSWLEADGFDPGLAIITAKGWGSTSTVYGRPPICLTNIPGGVFDYFKHGMAGYDQWKSTGNYPTLNAILPDTAHTPWSIRVMPAYASPVTPYVLSDLVKFYNAAAAQKTINVHMLLNASYGTPTTAGWWIEVFYTDSSGVARYESSRGLTGNNLSASLATWSVDPPVYGGNSYSKYKISLTTAYSIKQNTDIRVIVSSSVPATILSGDAADYYFVCPDFELVAP